MLRPGKRRLETVQGVVLKVWMRFAAMDITSVCDDADFVDKMIERGVFEAKECHESL